MSNSYQKRCLERDQLERVNERLRLQALVMAQNIMSRLGYGAPVGTMEKAIRIAREVTGIPEEPKKGRQMGPKLRGRAA